MSFYLQKNIIHKFLAPHFKKGEKIISIKILKRNPRGARSLVSLLYITNKDREFVGKIISTVFLLNKLAHILKYIQKYSPQRIAPRVIYINYNKNFLIYEKINGSALFDEIKKELPYDIFVKIIKNSAKTLTSLHNIPIKLKLERMLGIGPRYQTTYDPNKFFRLTTFVNEKLDSKFEKLKTKTYELSKILDERAAKFFDQTTVTKECLVHNDYHPEHIVYDKNFSTKIIDFDLANIGNYFWDIGRFLFKIELLGYLFYNKKITDITLSNIFLKEYLKNTKLETHDKKTLNNLLDIVRTDGIRIYILVCFKEKKEHYKDGINYEKTPKQFNKYLQFYLKYFKDLLKKINASLPKRT